MFENIEKKIDRLIDYVVLGGGYFAGFALLSCALITCYEVIARYLFNAPTHWTLELSIYLFIWFGFASMAYVQRAGKHVAVDVFVSRFPERTKALWNLVIIGIFFIFMLLLLYFGTRYTWKSILINEHSRDMWKVILWPVKAAVPIGALLLVLHLVREFVLSLRSFKKIPQQKGETFLDKPVPVAILLSVIIVCCVVLFPLNGVVGMVVLMLVLLFFGLPIFPTLGLVGALGLFFAFGGISALNASFARVSYGALHSFSLLCLPLFILVGQILQSGGVGEEIYTMATKWTNRLPGGEAIATILACTVFAAISTSSVATAITIGLIALPALALRKYDKKFSYGLLAAGGTLGIMVPPSGSMIIYAAMTEESLGKLFIAGLIPGIILAGAFICYSIIFCKYRGETEKPPVVTWQERFQALKTGLWGLAAPIIIMGGIYSGIFTPLESGAIAVLYSLFMVVGRGKLKIKDIPKVLRKSTESGTMVLSIIVGAMVLGNFMTMMRVPNMAMDFVASLDVSRWVVMIAIFGLLTILGMFLEVISTMMITLPILYPLIISLGFDGIWFAVMVTLVMEMALLTPPVGLNLYVILGITNASLGDVLRGVVPFFLIMIAGLLLFAALPVLSTWLPGMMFVR
ncbi:MAG TPA: TRAP transporter large permease subunit [Syntrophales bacterium]|nr:TRAP transporter large permease subunit [Syntrophales bacterium]